MRRIRWQLVLAAAWLLFTISLTSWWTFFALQRVDWIKTANEQDVQRYERMLLWEGAFMLIVIIAGGLALFYYILSEAQRNRQIHEFFATFTHELKTSMASLRLQAESLDEDLKETSHSRIVHRLVNETVRLEVKLENSLLLAQSSESRLHLEKLLLSRVLESVQSDWPHIKVKLNNDGFVLVDRRAMESILKNAIQNAVIHGRATMLEVSVSSANSSAVKILLTDNGIGFQGRSEKLGRLFFRHSSTSGSGVGLYLIRRLVQQMGGSVKFVPGRQGFGLTIVLRGETV